MIERGECSSHCCWHGVLQDVHTAYKHKNRATGCAQLDQLTDALMGRLMEKQTDGRQADRHTDRQTDSTTTDGQTNSQNESHTVKTEWLRLEW